MDKALIQGSNFPRIEICGGIASGKTTLAKLLGDSGFNSILENFQENPFLEIFYSSPSTYAFETEITFLLQHYNQIKINNSTQNLLVCDFSIYLDLAYSAVTLIDNKYQVFKTVYEEIHNELLPPHLLIYLQCSAATELKRIRSRNRYFEQSLDIEFLENLNQSLKTHINGLGLETKLLTINSEQQDFAHDQSIKRTVIDLVHAQI
jgi:deoxyadenosine/deoxycytidine kinase